MVKVVRLGARDEVNARQVGGMAGAPKLLFALESRWISRDQSQMSRDKWHSFDLTPWNHRWMTASNIVEFSDYSRRESNVFRIWWKLSLTGPDVIRLLEIWPNIDYTRGYAVATARNGYRPYSAPE